MPHYIKKDRSGMIVLIGLILGALSFGVLMNVFALNLY